MDVKKSGRERKEIRKRDRNAKEEREERACQKIFFACKGRYSINMERYINSQRGGSKPLNTKAYRPDI
eukprot:47765-Amorphochlora_amoeboformis.AAC.1